jgi:hypothetical protein
VAAADGEAVGVGDGDALLLSDKLFHSCVAK